MTVQRSEASAIANQGLACSHGHAAILKIGVVPDRQLEKVIGHAAFCLGRREARSIFLGSYTFIYSSPLSTSTPVVKVCSERVADFLWHSSVDLEGAIIGVVFRCDGSRCIKLWAGGCSCKVFS